MTCPECGGVLPEDALGTSGEYVCACVTEEVTDDKRISKEGE